MRSKEVVLRCILLAMIAVFSGVKPLEAGHETFHCGSPNSGAVECHCNGPVIQGWECQWPTAGWVNDGSMTGEFDSEAECQEAIEECEGGVLP